jgi:hypothetical protein
MTLADDIISELHKRSGLTAMEIAVNIFGRRQYYRKVYQECRRLVDAGNLERRGKGVQVDPFTYYLTDCAA